MAVGQADRLVPMLEDVLAKGGVSWPQISAIGVGIGPGNFTGIRISVAAARGLALALAIPAIGVTVLEALAFDTKGEVLVTLDGRLGRLYAQRFCDGLPMEAAKLCDYADLDGHPARCIGFDNEAIARRLNGSAGSSRTTPAPAFIARIAASRLSEPQPKPAPFYLRQADAAPSLQPTLIITP